MQHIYRQQCQLTVISFGIDALQNIDFWLQRMAGYDMVISDDQAIITDEKPGAGGRLRRASLQNSADLHDRSPAGIEYILGLSCHLGSHGSGHSMLSVDT